MHDSFASLFFLSLTLSCFNLQINFPSHFLLQIPPKDDRYIILYYTHINFLLYNTVIVLSLAIILLYTFSPIEGTEPMFIDAFARGVRRSYVECCAMINRVTKVDKADPTEVFNMY